MKLKARKKAVSVLLTFAMLITALSFSAGPAAAASNYTASSLPTVTAGTVHSGGTFNRIVVEIPVQVIPGTYNLRMRLPSDCYAVANAIKATVSSSEVNQIDSDPVATGIGTPKAGTNAYNEWDFSVTFGNTGTVAKFYIDLTEFHVASGISGDLNATFESSPSTPFSNATVKIASVGSGIVTVSIDEVNMITSSTGDIGTIRIKEDRPGALAGGASSVKLKLPNGFKWSIPANDAVLIWGDPAVVPKAANFTPDDNGRSLKIGRPSASGSTLATYYSISGLKVSVDESIARLGDLEVTVGGDSSVTPGTLVIAKYGDYGCKVSTADPAKLKAGRKGCEIGKIIIEESAGGSLVTGKTITLTLSGGGKWSRTGTGTAADPYVPANPPKINANLTDQQGLALGPWSFVGDRFETIKATVTSSSAGARRGGKLVLEKGNIDLPGDLVSDIKVTVGGTAGAGGEAGIVATSYIPAAVSIEGVAPDAVVGRQGQAIADIIVTEAAKECITASTSTVNIDGVNYQKNNIWLEFFQNVIPTVPANVEVVEGDIVIDKASLRRDVTGDGRWYIALKILSTSTKPSKIKFSGIKITSDRTTPEGPVRVALKGPALLHSADIFPGVNAMSTVAVVNIVTPADRDIRTTASFKIGDH
ncbi:MAG: hypothetical protein K6T65_14715 [Peptococcaceae bacterium]|nr:hypothetical protein [Peptococcaceae bacterium]